MGSQKIEAPSNGGTKITSFGVEVIAHALSIESIAITLAKRNPRRLDVGGDGNGQSTAGAPSDTTSHRGTGVASSVISMEAF